MSENRINGDTSLPKEQLIDLCSEFNSLKPYFSAVEFIADQPSVDAIRNEIRAIVTHFGRCVYHERLCKTDKARRIDFSVYDENCRGCDDYEVESNIAKAERHLKRCKLDCFKALCVELDIRTSDLLSDLEEKCSLIHVCDGMYAVEVITAKEKAVEYFTAAKICDAEGGEDEVVSSAYGKAFEKYSLFYELLVDPDAAVDSDACRDAQGKRILISREIERLAESETAVSIARKSAKAFRASLRALTKLVD
ncbi:hypothetical protein [Adlercreutzia sp. ZJ138]|uniref:hypothetical protein n=1 Tax=Adlercreutzia sp. ZJ138 TaxID=2709405 RepID=UPI0013ECB013|nr:hypothetical protein [Adlercreutzia sp. ZJ138]